MDQEDWECKTSAPSPQTNKPIWEIADEIIATIPEESFDQIPTDAAANLDTIFMAILLKNNADPLRRHILLGCLDSC
ncbi:hypothetical protein [Microcystis aeruginosa]|uniref:hypothetical protein n=1 Tax=Microcystis aeruginosa TaxID=1126 RepID=UPI001F4F8E7D|nr:hypothetical protein [Microcystis aeruginosa]